ncbi:MAG: hypothetical protein IJ191_02145 [Treponema sp.]|nr:hypothetical protein [Treponema sp.]
MSDSETLLEQKYQEAFDEEFTLLERRRAADAALTVADLEGTLKTLYVVQGNNWDGRSALLDTAISAQIAAYEVFIDRWKKEIVSASIEKKPI